MKISPGFRWPIFSPRDVALSVAACGALAIAWMGSADGAHVTTAVTVYTGFGGVPVSVSDPREIPMPILEAGSSKACPPDLIGTEHSWLRVTPTGLSLRFDVTQPRIVAIAPLSGIILSGDDTIALKITSHRFAGEIDGFTNANGACYVMDATGIASDKCAAAISFRNQSRYAGTLALDYSQLGKLPTDGSAADFQVRAERLVLVHDGAEQRACVLEMTPLELTVTQSANMSPERWLLSTAVANVTTPGATLPGGLRESRSAWIRPQEDLLWTLSPSLHASATFGQTGSWLLKTRKSALSKAPLNNLVASTFDCHACYSFQTTDTDAFSMPISKDRLGVDLSMLGADYTPLDFSQIGDVKTGYKLTTAGDIPIGIAGFSGTGNPDKNASFHFSDFAFSASNSKRFKSNDPITWAVLHVSANHSSSPDNPFAPQSRSFTTAYMLNISQPDITLQARGKVAHLALSSKTMLRYATGYGAGDYEFFSAQQFGFSTGHVPTEDVTESKSTPKTEQRARRTASLLTVGYREIGPAYQPLDATTDPLAGTHGVFADLSQTTQNSATEPYLIYPNASLLYYRFGDAAALRAVRLQAHAQVHLGKFTSLVLDDQAGSIAASVLSRTASPAFLFPDLAGGATLFPNNVSNASLAYDSAKFGGSLGYTISNQASCDQSASPKCVSKRARNITGSIFVATPSAFFAASYGNDAFPGITAPVQLQQNGSAAHPVTYNTYRAYAGWKFALCSVALVTYSQDPDTNETPYMVGGVPQKGTITAMIESDQLAQNDFLPNVGFVVGYQVVNHFNPKVGSPRVTTNLQARLRIGYPFWNYTDQIRRDCRT